MPRGLPTNMLVPHFKYESKLNIQKTKIMASGPITSWEIDGETVERVSDLDTLIWQLEKINALTL